MLIRFAIPLLGTLLVLGCAHSTKTVQPSKTGQSAKTKASGAYVSQVLCSGLPDPAWSLSDSAVAELRQRAAKLPQTQSAPEIPGWSGAFIIVLSTGQEYWELYKGYLSIWEGTKKTYWVDTDNTLRDWLLPQMNAQTRIPGMTCANITSPVTM